MKFTKILLSIAIMTITASTSLASDFNVGAVTAKTDMNVLNQLNDRANELLPMDRMILSSDPVEAQTQISKYIKKQMGNNILFIQGIQKLRADIASFLVSGGIVITKIDTSDATVQNNISAFDDIKSINPLMILLTRSVLFESGKKYVKNGESFYFAYNDMSFFKVMAATALVFIGPANFIGPYIVYVIAQGKELEHRAETVSTQNVQYLVFQKCALATLSDDKWNQLSGNSATCGTKESLELVPNYRKYTLGSILLHAFSSTQVYRNLSAYEKSSFDSGDLEKQADDLKTILNNKGIALIPGDKLILNQTP